MIHLGLCAPRLEPLQQQVGDQRLPVLHQHLRAEGQGDLILGLVLVASLHCHRRVRQVLHPIFHPWMMSLP